MHEMTRALNRADILASMMAATLFVAVALCAAGAHAQTPGFKFSNEDKAAEQEKAARDASIAAQLSTPCRDLIKNRKIAVIIGERINGVMNGRQDQFSPLFDAINSRLRNLGLRTATQAEIHAQIAQAELDAYLKNDADAALAASRKFGASYTLRGVISATSTVNPVLKINQVIVSMRFTLGAAANGKILSQVERRSESYAGADVEGMALTLVNEQADEVVARLYSDFCTSAGRN
jgi:hypothetical protein